MHKAARSVRSPNRYGQVQTQLPERAPSLVMGVPEPQTNMPVVEKFGQLVRATTYLFNPANVPLCAPRPESAERRIAAQLRGGTVRPLSLVSFASQFSKIEFSLEDDRFGSAPIHRLPGELLAIVLDLSLDHGPHSSERILRTITTSHVCRYWRNVMLETALFWSLIDLRYPTIGRHFCARSRTAGIQITFSQALFTDVHAVLTAAQNWLSPHIRRIESIHLSASQTTMKQVLYLCRSASPDIANLFAGLANRMTAGPTLFVEFHNARIRRISLDGVALSGRDRLSMFPASLTRLAFSRLHRDTCLSVAQVLAILKHCPNMKEVVLLSALAPRPGGATEEFDSSLLTHLPYLQSLQIGDASRAAVVSLLSYLSLPHTATLGIHCHGTHDLRALLPADLSGLRMCCPPPGPHISTALQVTPSHIALVNQRGSRHLSSVHFAVAPDDVPHILAGAPSLGSLLAGVTGLQAASSAPSVPIHAWAATFACLPQLATFELGGAWTYHILLALGAASAPPRGESAGITVPCPRLRCVHLVDTHRSPGVNILDALRQLESLERCLAARAQYLGSPLEMLVVDATFARESTQALSFVLTRLRNVTRRMVLRDRRSSLLIPNCAFLCADGTGMAFMPL
ncbi:hypothetical protein IEO21_08690 [Rhodonia placenta]|uniref:F-box domain-containing protein n=1 Tax=Rhodonia placenta TaxID=104341 RepID=A0A8H7NVZ5_9APHY|nr:hypothetical protein IEO21_08690 [Postia placenta]